MRLDLRQGFEEALLIRIVMVDHLAPVAASHDVVDRSGVPDPRLARRAGRVPLASCGKSKTPL